MKLANIFEKKTVFSIEIFPPKAGMGIESVYKTLDGVEGLRPDFVSVTYGAGGNADKISPSYIAATVKQKYSIEPVAHLPCVHTTKEEVQKQLDEFKQHGIDNILALRGDRVPGRERGTDFKYASDLVKFIRENGDFHIIGACYPEGHPESGDLDADIENLKRKVDAGAEHLITQLYFDNEIFYRFLDKIRKAGINVPVEAGIMPVVNKNQILRMVSLCGASLPPKFAKMIQKYEPYPEALRDAGIAYAVDQIIDLTASGADGIHLYTMNNPYVAKRISDALPFIYESRV